MSDKELIELSNNLRNMNLEDSEIKEFKIFTEGVATDEGTSSSTIIQRPENNTRIFERRIFKNTEFIEAKKVIITGITLKLKNQ